MEPQRPGGYLPELDRISALAAMILITYALSRYINFPGREVGVQLPGIYLSVDFNAQFLVALVVAGLTTAGVDWLLRDHPALAGRSTLEHWLIPTLTALIISMPLSQLPDSPIWWVAFLLGGVLLILVVLAEYIVVDPDDLRYPIAAAGLILLSFTLYLVLASALRYSGARLYLLLPALGTATILVSLRALQLRLHSRWAFLQAGVVALITIQLGAAIFYWPLSPVSFGLAVLGITYAMTILLGNLINRETFPHAFVEPLIMLLLIWGAAVWIR